MVEEVDLCSRSVCQITFRQHDIAKVSRRNFSVIVINTFNRNGMVKLSRWVYSKEKHKNGEPYEHIVLKLD